MDLARNLLQLCRDRGWMIVTAESCTGGLIAGALTEIPGSSDVVDRGFVTYSYPSKTDLLGVPADMLEAHGAVSEPVARAMADGAIAASSAQVALSVTGVAGPGGSEAKPEGMVWFGFAIEGRQTETQVMEFGAVGRANVRQAAVEFALAHAAKLIIGPA